MSQDNLTLVLHKAKDARLEQTPIPNDIGPDDALIKTLRVGICGSDVHYWQRGEIGPFVLKAPMILGHETCGQVVKIGENVKNVKIGDVVAIEPGISCGKCDVCKAGRYNLCKEMVFHATPPHDGTLRRYFKHPAHLCFPIPDNMTPEEGACIEPLSVGMHGCNRANIKPGETLLIGGAGPIGLFTLLVAKAYGARDICITDINQNRLDFAKKVGADFTLLVKPGQTAEQISKEACAFIGGNGYEKIIECSGAEISIQSNLMAGAPGSTFVLTANCQPMVTVPLVCCPTREMDIKGVFRYVGCYKPAIHLVATGRISIKNFITDSFPLEKSLDAFELARGGTAIKVIIDCEQKK